MWNLAFSFTIQHRAAAFKAYYKIRSFITFHGIFMGPGYDIGHRSVWKEGVLKSKYLEAERKEELKEDMRAKMREAGLDFYDKDDYDTHAKPYEYGYSSRLSDDDELLRGHEDDNYW